MNPVQMVKSISLKTKQVKWSVSLFARGCCNRWFRWGWGDPWAPASCKAVFPWASGWDGVTLLSALSIFIVFPDILSDRALILYIPPLSALWVIGLPCFMELSYGTQIWQMSVLLSWSFVDLMLLLCYTISALPFTLTSLSWDSNHVHGC